MALEIIFRGNGEWGAGIGRKLHAPEHDQNFYNIKVAIETLQTDRPKPDEFAQMGTRDLNMVVTLVSGREFVFPIPIVKFGWRGTYAPFMILDALDAFRVAGVGLFSVLEPHTAPATFTPNLTIGGKPAYDMLFGADAGAAAGVVINDMGFFYQGVISESDDAILWELPMVREIILPIPVTLHRARLREAPSTAAQVFPLFHNSVQYGTITFGIGQEIGVFSFTETVRFEDNDMLGVGKPPLEDATARGLSVLMAATRLLIAA